MQRTELDHEVRNHPVEVETVVESLLQAREARADET